MQRITPEQANASYEAYKAAWEAYVEPIGLTMLDQMRDPRIFMRLLSKRKWKERGSLCVNRAHAMLGNRLPCEAGWRHAPSQGSCLVEFADTGKLSMMVFETMPWFSCPFGGTSRCPEVVETPERGRR